MALADDWETGRTERSKLETVGSSILRMTLLFGSAAVALALIAAPILDRQVNSSLASAGYEGLDMTSTGTIGYRGTYTIRKSVLQDTPNSICVIRANGTRSGDC